MSPCPASGRQACVQCCGYWARWDVLFWYGLVEVHLNLPLKNSVDRICFFWDITLRQWVIRPILFLDIFYPWRWGHYVASKRRNPITHQHTVISWKERNPELHRCERLKTYTVVTRSAQFLNINQLHTIHAVYLCFVTLAQPITVAARSEAWVCGRSLAGMRVRIPPGAWMSVSCECCVLSGRGLCDGPIPRPEESYWVWCVWVWSIVTITLHLQLVGRRGRTKKGRIVSQSTFLVSINVK